MWDSIWLAVHFQGGQPGIASCLEGVLRGREEGVLGDEKPKSITLIERLLEERAESRGLHFCCEGRGKPSPRCDAAGRVAGLASCPLQKG